MSCPDHAVRRARSTVPDVTVAADSSRWWPRTVAGVCFSPQADPVGGGVLVVLGVDAVRHVHQRRDHLPLAPLPLLLAGHQVGEAFAWSGLQAVGPRGRGVVAAWIDVFVAFVVLPVRRSRSCSWSRPAGGIG